MSTFFITAKSNPTDDLHTTSSYLGGFETAESANFDGVMLPLAVVTVVCLQPEIRPFNTTYLTEVWRTFLVPGTVPIQAARWRPPLEFSDWASVTIDGKQQQNPYPMPSLADKVAEHACCTAQILTSYKAVSKHNYAFITARETAHYHRLPCRISMRIKSWSDVPRCTASYDDALQSLQDFLLSGTPSVENSVDSVALRATTNARDKFCKQARELSPESGSFIPCSLWCGADKFESDCVLQIVDDVSATEKICHLHVLSQFDDLKLLHGMELRLTVDVLDNLTRKTRKIVTDFGEIIG